jgi:TP901 family phage tail tape measure protein
VNSTINQQRAELKGTAGVWGFLKSEVGKFGAIAVAALGFDAVIGKINNLISRSAKLSDAIADVQMTTGLSAQAVEQYNKALGTLNTRTSREDLLGIGKIAGQFGVAKDEMLEFTKAMNKTSVVLGSEFSGGAEEITEKMATLRNVFSDIKTDNISDDITKISNAVVTLAQEGVATAPVVTDFANRIAGVGINLGLTTPQVLGLSATMQELGITAERGGTAVGKILQKMTTNTDEFAKVAGMSLKDFSALVDKDIYQAFLRVLEGSKKGGEAATVLGRLIKDLEISGAGASEVFSKLGGNMDLLAGRTKLAGSAIKETSAITEQYNLKNENFAANLERIQKVIAAIFMNSALIGGVQTFVGWLVKLTEVNLSDSFRQEQAELNVLVGAIQMSNNEYGNRQQLIKELQEKFPSFLGNLNAETVTNEQLQTALDAVNKEYVKKIFLQQNAEKMQEFAEKEIELMKELQEETKRLAKEGKQFRVEQGGEVRLLSQDIQIDISQTKKAIGELKKEREDFLKGQNELARALGIDTKQNAPNAQAPGRVRNVADAVDAEDPKAKAKADKAAEKMRKANENAMEELRKHLADMDEVLQQNDIKRELTGLEKREKELAAIDNEYSQKALKAFKFNEDAQANENLTKQQKKDAEIAFNADIQQLEEQRLAMRSAKEEEWRIADEAKKAEFRQKMLFETASSEDQELMRIREHYMALIAEAEKHGFDSLALYRSMDDAMQLAKAKSNAKVIKDTKKTEAEILRIKTLHQDLTITAASAVGNALTNIFAATSKNQRDLAIFSQSIAIAEALISQGVAISRAAAAYAAKSTDPVTYGLQVAAAVATIIGTIAGAISTINRASVPSAPSLESPGSGGKSSSGGDKVTNRYYYGGETGDENGKFVGMVHANEYVTPSFIRHHPAVINATAVTEAVRQNAIRSGNTSYSGPPPAMGAADISGGGMGGDNMQLAELMNEVKQIKMAMNRPVVFAQNEYERFQDQTVKIQNINQ